ITDAARIVATPASTAFPPFCRILKPASTESGWPPATTPRLPRTTGLKVSACEVERGNPVKTNEVTRHKTNAFRLVTNMAGHLSSLTGELCHKGTQKG